MGTRNAAALENLITLGVSILAGFALVKWVVGSLDPLRNEKKQGRQARADLVRRGLTRLNELVCSNDYEEILLSSVVDPSQIDVTLDDIGGLEDTKETVQDLIVMPLQHPELFQSSPLLTLPRGILLFGPPGTGKTMLAKALAKESGCCFLHLEQNQFLSKWFGESQKLIKAAFTLADKLAPCIIYLDEAESFLSERRAHEEHSTSAIKSEFLSLWDGLLSSDTSQVIVVVATNRPWELDKAVLRRLPRQFALEMPDKSNRRKILETILKNQNMEPDFDWEHVANETEGYSGSDLKELCKAATFAVAREHLKSFHKSSPSSDRISHDSISSASPADRRPLRPLSTADVAAAMRLIRPAGVEAAEYFLRNIQHHFPRS